MYPIDIIHSNFGLDQTQQRQFKELRTGKPAKTNFWTKIPKKKKLSSLNARWNKKVCLDCGFHSSIYTIFSTSILLFYCYCCLSSMCMYNSVFQDSISIDLMVWIAFWVCIQEFIGKIWNIRWWKKFPNNLKGKKRR